MVDLVKPMMEIEIEGESYALDKIPSDGSGVVKAEEEKLLREINLKALVSDLGRVGDFIGIAYNDVGAAGYQHTEEQIEIQQLGYDITKLCNKSALTIVKFKKASSSILTDLQCTYGYLLDGLKEMALETLFSVSKLAGEMEKAALELHHDFVAEEKKVTATLENTQNAKKVQACEVDEEKRRRIQLEEDSKHEQDSKYEHGLIKDHQEKKKEVEDRHRFIEHQKDKAISKIDDKDLTHLSDVMMQAALFWKQMQDYCSSLADSQMKSQVEAVIEYPKEIQLKRWTLKSFKHKAFEFSSSWVALNSVCTVYMEQIKDTEPDLHKYFTKYLTYEESKRNRLALGEKFMGDLKSDQKALEEKDFKAQKEILAIGNLGKWLINSLL